MDEKKDLPTVERLPPLQETVPDLKTLREASGLSLTDIFAQTRVGLINLEAVENGDFDRLPPPVYARDFIRKYARTVGIDEKPILHRYEKYLEGQQPTIEETEIRKPWPETGRRYRFLIASLAAVIIAGVLVSALFLYDKGGKPAGELPSPAEVIPGPAPAATVPAPSAATTTEGSVPVGAPGPAGPPSTAKDAYRLVIETREPTWIRVTEDRNRTFEAILKPGEKIERTASDHFWLDIGNAGGIDLTFQGKPLGSPGKSGQVLHMRLPEKEPDRKAP